MGYYCAWGDAKMTCSSEEEGYDECRVSDSEERKRKRVSGIFDEMLAEREREPQDDIQSSGAVLPVSDDADRQFWAEDELSNSESRQRLTAIRKRRHSISYRNRATNRSQSSAPNSSNSSSNSIYAETPLKVCKIRKYCRRQNIKKLQSVDTEKESSANIDEIANGAFSPENQIASTSDKKSIDFENHGSNLSCRNCRNRMKDTIRANKIGMHKTRGPSNK